MVSEKTGHKAELYHPLCIHPHCRLLAMPSKSHVLTGTGVEDTQLTVGYWLFSDSWMLKNTVGISEEVCAYGGNTKLLLLLLAFQEKELSVHNIQKSWKRQPESVNTLQEPTWLNHTRRDVTMAFLHTYFFGLYNDAKVAFSWDLSTWDSKARDWREPEEKLNSQCPWTLDWLAVLQFSPFNFWNK